MSIWLDLYIADFRDNIVKTTKMVRLAICFLFMVSLALIELVKSSACPCTMTTSYDDVIDNHSLIGQVIRSQTVHDVGQCFHQCIYDDRCKSFNTGKERKGWLCELNKSNKALSPSSFQEIQRRTYYEVNSRLPSEPSYFKNCSCHHYIELSCECLQGYVGNHCHIKARSCLDYLLFKKTYSSGNYTIFDDNNDMFAVYCHMDHNYHGKMSAWTAVLSYALKYNSLFQKVPFYIDNPINQSSPNWQLYRLSLSRMKAMQSRFLYWRVSCNYSTFGIDGRDYAMAKWTDIDLLTLNGGGCHRFVYINVRGSHCSNCTTWVHQGLQGSRMFLVAVSYGVVNGCDLPAPSNSKLHDEIFGFYTNVDPDFRCTINEDSTTQFWIGGSME